jgi:hypothetical protein
VLEVFANERVAVTTRVYTAPGGPLQVEVADPEGLESVEVWGMRSISPDRLTGAETAELSRGERWRNRGKLQ